MELQMCREDGGADGRELKLCGEDGGVVAAAAEEEEGVSGFRGEAHSCACWAPSSSSSVGGALATEAQIHPALAPSFILLRGMPPLSSFFCSRPPSSTCSSSPPSSNGPQGLAVKKPSEKELDLDNGRRPRSPKVPQPPLRSCSPASPSIRGCSG